MKHLRKQAEAAQSAKLHRLGAMGSLKAARKAEHAPRKYASGGAVMDDAGPVEGMAAKGRLDRPGRSKMSKKGGKDASKKGTTVNVVIASGGGPKPPMPMAGPPPDMPMPPPGAGPGGPPMPMRAKGGRVSKADGGPTISQDSKDEAKRLRSEGNGDYWKGLVAANIGNAALMTHIPGARGIGQKLGNGVKNAVTGLGWATGVKGVKNSFDKSAEADRIEKGQAKEGEEDRKSGGRVKRGKC